MSFRRKIRALHDECRVNCRGTRAKTAPWGLLGGHDGGTYRIERDEGVAPFEKSVGWLNSETGQYGGWVRPRHRPLV